jgi:hypothetical protein
VLSKRRHPQIKFHWLQQRFHGRIVFVYICTTALDSNSLGMLSSLFQLDEADEERLSKGLLREKAMAVVRREGNSINELLEGLPKDPEALEKLFNKQVPALKITVLLFLACTFCIFLDREFPLPSRTSRYT